MQSQDLVFINVVGVNGTTRNQRAITEKFNGAGVHINDKGEASGKPDVLNGLPNGAASPAPEFPAAEYAAAAQKGAAGAEEVKAIMLAHSERVAKWEKSQTGGSEKLQIVKSVLAYAEKYHGFKQTDGDWFVLKAENLDVNTTTLPDGRTLTTVAGTAVFG